MKHTAAGGTRPPRAKAAEVNAAIDAVRAYWEEGRQSLKRFPASGKPRDNPEFKGLDPLGGKRQFIQMRRRAAAAFDAKSLEAFLRACRKAACLPTVAMLYQLAMIPEHDRPGAQRKALAGHW